MRDFIKRLSEYNSSSVKSNFINLNWWQLTPPLLILVSVFYFFSFTYHDSFTGTYLNSQKEVFIILNRSLSSFSQAFFNITQLGDVLIIFPFLFIFMIIAPKLWEAIILSSLFTLIFSAALKSLFSIPRPAAFINTDTFCIVGSILKGKTSLPSGHSMTAFMLISILLYAFMPKTFFKKVLWTTGLLLIGLCIAISRVSIGAHYPMDVLLGSSFGFILGFLGIKISLRFSWLEWMKRRKFYPVLLSILSVWLYLISLKLLAQELIIFYLSLLSLILSFCIVFYQYTKGVKLIPSLSISVIHVLYYKLSVFFKWYFQFKAKRL